MQQARQRNMYFEDRSEWVWAGKATATVFEIVNESKHEVFRHVQIQLVDPGERTAQKCIGSKRCFYIALFKT